MQERFTFRMLALVATAAALSAAGAGVARAAPRPQPDIVGGGSTAIDQWPWQVAIARPPASGGDGFDRQFCGGSLISATAVLTAAHCVYDGGFKQPASLSVIAGRTNLSNGAAGAEIPATDVIYFASVGGVATPQSVSNPPAGPQLYNAATSEWDAAIIELAAPAPPPAAPIALASPSERGLWDAGDVAYATGWGDTTGAGSYPDDLHAVELNVVADGDCGDAGSYGSGFFPATMVCAGNPPAGGEDTCQGDSGGPLVAPAPGDGFRLIGTTSFGVGCALPEKWGVYSRVADTTMRRAILEGASIAPGGPGTPALDRTPPETRLGKHPGRRTHKRRVKFTFSATEAATFSCRLDRGAPKPCSSPFKKRRVSRGRHRFRVLATDAIGNVEASPSSFRWRVTKRKRR